MNPRERLIELLPELVAAGLLDSGGGSAALRTPEGIVVTPTQASRLLRWKLAPEDFVLFPGGGQASMARAGRQPSRENKLHRAVLAAHEDWNCTLLAQGWGLIGFALRGVALRVPEAHAWPVVRGRDLLLPLIAAAPEALPDAATASLAEHYAGRELGAVLIRDMGALIAGAQLEAVLSLAQTLETLARAQLPLLAVSPPG